MAPPTRRQKGIKVTIALTPEANALLRAMVPKVHELGAFISGLLTREAMQRATRDHESLDALCAELIMREAETRVSQLEARGTAARKDPRGRV